MQLDDWWYQGPFYFGNVKCVDVWAGDPSPSLFPHGIPAFQSSLDLPLLLYTPFWCSAFNGTGPSGQPWNMTPSTSLPGTKVIVPDESYNFFTAVLDTGMALANGRMAGYEIDFLGSNTAGSPALFETPESPYIWYRGLDQAAREHNVSIQFCLAYPADILMSLQLPSVSHARASTDYCVPDKNTAQVGSSSLLYGALGLAPSKDTFWTRGVQPMTMCDQNGDYSVQEHVALDAALAALSMGPVALGDAVNYTDPSLVLQTCMADGTLLQPDRPLAWIDSTILNYTLGAGSGVAQDVRSTAVTVPVLTASSVAASRSRLVISTSAGYADPSLQPPSTSSVTPVVSTAYYFVAWRTNASVALASADFYPALGPGSVLAVHKHNWTEGGAQTGCTNRGPLASCVTLYGPGESVVLPPSNTEEQGWHLHTVVPRIFDRWHILGELGKFASVSNQRIASIHGDEQGVTIIVRGAEGEGITLTVVDAVCGCTLVDSMLVEGNGVASFTFV